MTGQTLPDVGRSGTLALQRVTKRYGAVAAVHDLSLFVQPGEFFTLLGPSGSGKTTTLMMVAGFVSPDSGAILLDERSVEHVPAEQRNLGVVFQNYALFPHMTVWENIAFPLEARRLPASKIEHRISRVLALVRLEQQVRLYPSQLSGGQQQRVALARALVFEPSVLLMDEPLGALDKSLRTHLQGELKSLQRQLGITVLYVTHDQDEALTMSDRIAVMNRGRIEQVGEPWELYENPLTLFVAQFFGDTNMLTGRIIRHREAETEIRLDDTHMIVSRPCHFEMDDAVVVALRPERLSLDSGNGTTADLCTLSGTIDEVLFAGDSIKYWVSLTDDIRIMIKVQNADGRTHRVHGESVQVRYRPDSVRVFAAPLG